jgi:hypothetical protein
MENHSNLHKYSNYVTKGKAKTLGSIGEVNTNEKRAFIELLFNGSMKGK